MHFFPFFLNKVKFVGPYCIADDKTNEGNPDWSLAKRQKKTTSKLIIVSIDHLFASSRYVSTYILNKDWNYLPLFIFVYFVFFAHYYLIEFPQQQTCSVTNYILHSIDRVFFWHAIYTLIFLSVINEAKSGRPPLQLNITKLVVFLTCY